MEDHFEKSHIHIHCVFFINGTDQITKSVNIKVNMNLNDKSLTNFGKSIQNLFCSDQLSQMSPEKKTS